MANVCSTEEEWRLAPALLGPSGGRPRLRLVEGTGEDGARRGAFAVAAVALVLVVLLALPLRALGGQTLARPAGPLLRPGEVYTVRPGDTLWGIAGRLAPGIDPRVEVARLEEAIGSTSVEAGERLRLP